jgi:hypothetical protein
VFIKTLKLCFQSKKESDDMVDMTERESVNPGIDIAENHTHPQKIRAMNADQNLKNRVPRQNFD